MENKDIFYNYVYVDPRKPGVYNYGDFHFDYEPFLIGKGKNDRMYDHLYENEETTYNPHKVRKINKIKKAGLEPIIYKIIDNLDERAALDNEIKLIATIGRHDKGLGPLTNLTDGGTGGDTISNHPNKKEMSIKKSIIQVNIWKNLTGEYRNKRLNGIVNYVNNLTKEEKELHIANLVKINTGRKNTVESNEKIRIAHIGKKQSKETIEKRIKKTKGQKRSIEQKKKYSDSKIGNKNPALTKYIIETPDKKIVEMVSMKSVMEFIGCSPNFFVKKRYKEYKLLGKIKVNQ